MKKLFLLIVFVLVGIGCSDNLSSLNENEKSPTMVPAEVLFTNAQKTLTNQIVSTSVNNNIFRLVSQQWTETTYIDESNYDWSTRKISDNVWASLYAGTLADLENARISLLNLNIDPSQTDQIGIRKNKLAMIDIVMVYTYQTLVDIFGDIPYSEALKGDSNYLPKYDNALTIYSSLISRLDNDLSNLSNYYSNFDNADVIYNGNLSKWIKLANSIKLKLGINLLASNANNTLANSTIISAVSGGVLSSNADNCKTPYELNSPNQNPLYLDLVASGRSDFVVTKPLVDKLLQLNDPRRPLYTNGNTNGGIVGQLNPYGSFTHIGAIIKTPNFKGTLLDYAEVEFLLAEAVERGVAVGGTAENHYNNAITASMLDWGVAQNDITTYLAQPSVAYSTASGTWQQKIGEQAWLGLYNRGFEAWTSYRRLNYPNLIPSPNANADAEGKVPVRMKYPIREQTLNATNYQGAAAAIGGDKLVTKIFWDVN
ncbi:SusD/RagB family nutrient-binding outer membrane lipoprotein [Flavobacterium sp. SUN046]|uniref:SusD/RagB family nutrient-binding outer membrane lipoprotein n=1 Tax=Flavobacterium sp. SUN046 TaxID=3002440 RepID=UPI002DBF95C1|nr:SusD/RagB family nutrient-binding outer membrane lipoprotein [Flavobacterium sp. SUN046]MEC4049719.1 SusD/RagB family nutrient-binding outer membrane lipoprotein [Flavobacterium sp. SUN046]